MIFGAAGICGLSAGVALLTGDGHNPLPRSTPECVTPSCNAAAHARSCTVPLRYLAAHDLDHAGEACVLLAPEALSGAGGMTACKRTLLRARGIRIRYRISSVAPSPFGTTIRFSTRAGGDRWPFRQQMLVSPAGRIVAVVPEPW